MNALPLEPALAAKVESVRRTLAEHAPVLIAYSGGVDSATLLALALQEPALPVQAVIADSPSLPRRALASALAEGERLGATVRLLATREMENPAYAANPLNRCYFCKAELFQQMETLARQEGFRGLAYGENADDVAQDRPGSRAAAEFAVLAPLRAAGLRKAEVRALARWLGLTVAEAPAQPCLSSRLPTGVPVTEAALTLVEKGEDFLRELGFHILRVRYQPAPGAGGPTARVLVAPAELPRLRSLEETVRNALTGLGFASVEIDPAGYQGPSLA
jgi:uncharacterized protein